MTKQELLQQLNDLIPDGSSIEYSSVTVLTPDYQTICLSADYDQEKLEVH